MGLDWDRGSGEVAKPSARSGGGERGGGSPQVAEPIATAQLKIEDACLIQETHNFILFCFLQIQYRSSWVRPQTINKRIYQNVYNNLTQNPQIFSYPALVAITTTTTTTTTNETSGDRPPPPTTLVHAFTVVDSHAGGHYETTGSNELT